MAVERTGIKCKRRPIIPFYMIWFNIIKFLDNSTVPIPIALIFFVAITEKIEKISYIHGSRMLGCSNTDITVLKTIQIH